MSDQQPINESFLPYRDAAVRLGVPAAWLRAEAEAGRIPHLHVGRRLLLNVEAVERALLARAQQAAHSEAVDRG